MDQFQMKALALSALSSIEAGMIVLEDLGKQHQIPDAEMKSVADFFADARSDLTVIRDDQP
jgi:hypothetical protein